MRVRDRHDRIAGAVQDERRRQPARLLRQRLGQEAEIVDERPDAPVGGRERHAERAAERGPDDADPARIDAGLALDEIERIADGLAPEREVAADRRVRGARLSGAVEIVRQEDVIAGRGEHLRAEAVAVVAAGEAVGAVEEQDRGAAPAAGGVETLDRDPRPAAREAQIPARRHASFSQEGRQCERRRSEDDPPFRLQGMLQMGEAIVRSMETVRRPGSFHPGSSMIFSENRQPLFGIML